MGAKKISATKKVEHAISANNPSVMRKRLKFQLKDKYEEKSVKNYTFQRYRNGPHCPSLGVFLRGNFDDIPKLKSLLHHNLPVILVEESGGFAGAISEFLQNDKPLDEKIKGPLSLRRFLERNFDTKFDPLNEFFKPRPSNHFKA